MLNLESASVLVEHRLPADGFLGKIRPSVSDLGQFKLNCQPNTFSV